MELPVSRTVSAKVTHILDQNHESHFCIGYVWQFWIWVLFGLMRIYHHSNDTMLAQIGVASFENTLCKGYIYFGPKSWITLLYRINVTILNMSIIWFNEDITPLQRHHARPKWNCQFREHSLQRLHIFWTKVMNHTFVWDKCDNFECECYLV